MKRSGRTIIKVLSGLLIYAGFIVWYDGSKQDPREVKNLDLHTLPNSLQSSAERIRETGDTGPVYLVVEKGPVSHALINWWTASVPDPIVKLQIQGALKRSYPEQGFTVVRFRNLTTFTRTLARAEARSHKPEEGILLSSQRFFVNMKLLLGGSLGLLILLRLRKGDQPQK